MLIRVFFSLALAGTWGWAQLLPVTAHVQRAAVGPGGSLYFAGYSSAPNLPTVPGVIHPNPPYECTPSVAFCQWGFVAKVSAAGETLLWVTYFGYSVDGLALAADGTAYIAGSTRPKDLLPASGTARLFVARLSADGKSLLASADFGGESADTVASLKLDVAGNVYIAGTAVSDDFPTTPGAYQRQRLTGPPYTCNGPEDLFVAKFDPGLGELIFSTLIGTAWREAASDFAIGQDGTLYVAGTRGTERGPCPAWPIVARLNPNASALLYSTQIEGAITPYGAYALAVAPDGSAFAAGDSRKWVPPKKATFWKLNPHGSVVASRNAGGGVTSLGVSAGGEIVAAGEVAPARFAPTAGSPVLCMSAFERHSPSAEVVYVARLNPSTLEYDYAGYLPSSQAWLAGPERVVAAQPYSTALAYSVLAPGAPAPGTVTCTTSAATYDNTAAAPGEVITLFGNQIGPAEAMEGQVDAGGNYKFELGGVRVSVGGVPAPLLYAAPNQINLVMPFGVPPGDKVRIQVRRGGVLLASFEKDLVAYHPGLFTADASGLGQLAALNQDLSINSAANPATPGSVVAVYATGLGAMAPQPMDGSRPAEPVSKPVVTPEVWVDSLGASIEYIGNAPTLVQGVLQINVRIPESARSGAVAVDLAYGTLGPRTSGGTIAVR